MSGTPDITVLCISSYFKGEAFMRAAKKEGARVFLLTEEKLAGEQWPRESIDEIFLMPDLTKLQDVTNAVTYLSRANQIDIIVPLDEYDVETVAALREHVRIPGMGQTATRNFRDKLVMREQAHKRGIRVPQFTKILNYDALREFIGRVPPPWVLKPRTEAGSMGIKKLQDSEQLWRWLDQLGDRQSSFLLEQYVPGDVYHVDSIIYKRKVIFASVQKYGQPPMDVAHGGGVFTTRTLAPDSDEANALKALNTELIDALGMEHGVTHAEYIKGHGDGQFYFLEIAARVGGAHISDLIEAATGLNPWAEWARLEIAIARGRTYKLPKTRQDFGGLLVCLAKQEYPDMSAYHDPEVVWKMNKQQHAGLIVVSPDANRVQSLMNSYVERFGYDFLAVAPAKDARPTH